MRPEDVWPVDGEYRETYEGMVQAGRAAAGETSVAIVGIARNARPFLANTIRLVDELRRGFASASVYVFENDSEDGTDRLLDSFPWITVEHETLGGIDSRGFERERTERLAYCRNKCHDWVRKNAAGTAWTIVLDMDPQYGFSVDGVFNSIGWLGTLGSNACPVQAGGMAAYSLLRNAEGIAHYDAWAARPVSWWRDRKYEIGFQWFSYFLPPVGSPPAPFNSAFGGLCVYTTAGFLAAGERPYEGGDCEHVFLHRKMRAAGHQLYLNPGSRYIALWPTPGGE